VTDRRNRGGERGSRHARERWGSRVGFVLATAGSAVGLGNIWRFPSAAAENGGGAFVALFLLVVLVVGVPGLMAELGLGRRAACNALDAFLAVRPRTWWAVAGALALFGSFLVLSYYAVIAGWVLAYVFKALGGSLRDLDAPALRDAYAAFVGHPWHPVAWQAAFLALGCLMKEIDPFEVPSAIQRLTPRALDRRLREHFRPENLAVSVVLPK